MASKQILYLCEDGKEKSVPWDAKGWSARQIYLSPIPYERWHEISNTVACVTSKASDQPLLVACIFYDYKATDLTAIGVSKLKRRLHRLVWVYTCQNATLLEITFHGSYHTHDGLVYSCLFQVPPRVQQQIWETVPTSTDTTEVKY